MKFSDFLINEIINLPKKYNVSKLTKRSKHKEIQKRLNQLFRLTSFLNSKEKIGARIYCLKKI